MCEVAFLSLLYVSITVSAKAVTTDISYFGAILLKKITRVVLQAICNERGVKIGNFNICDIIRRFGFCWSAPGGGGGGDLSEP